MGSLFDPSAFIEAERSQSLAKNSSTDFATFEAPKMAENRHSRAFADESLAGIATLAAVDAEKHSWTEDLERWAASDCPDFIRPEKWDEITHEAMRVSQRWGSIATACGWTSLNLFGCHARPQFRRLDHNGLVQTIVGLLIPVRITEINEAHAVVIDHNGSVMRHQRRDKPGQVHLWEAYVMSTGP